MAPGTSSNPLWWCYNRCSKTSAHHHVGEALAGVGARDGEAVGRAGLLQRQQRHVPPEHGRAAAPEPRLVPLLRHEP